MKLALSNGKCAHAMHAGHVQKDALMLERYPCCSTLLRYLVHTAVLALLAISVSAVLYGDEQFGNIPGGRFWAFHSAGVSIVNPETCSVEHTFSTDNEGSFLPNSWYDGVYMETLEKNYVVINSGVTKFDSHENLEGGAGEVIVFSADPADYANPVKSKVLVGGQPVHSYAVYIRDEVSLIKDDERYSQ